MATDLTDIQTAFSFINVNNKNLRLQSIVHPDGKDKPYLVFLHEGLGCIELWKGFPEKVAAALGQNAIVYERQGYGQSDHLDLPRPKDYLQQEALLYLPELLQKLNIENPILFGHSDGGSIALIYAGAYPCTALITEAAHIYVEDITIEGIEKVKANPDLDIIKQKLKKYHGDKTEDIFSAWADTWLDPDFKDWNISPLLKNISCPLLLIQGLDDEYATVGHIQKIKEAMPKAASINSFLPENCGHIPHLQAADAVFEKTVAFIKGLKR
jgi:pimeloyl-ACP methyl ester carboxylesterase